MSQKISKGIKDLLNDANQVVKAISIEKCKSVQKNTNFVFVDLRDYREILKEGKIPGAFSCPRGMLEFWIDQIALIIKNFLIRIKLIFFIMQALRGYNS